MAQQERDDFVGRHLIVDASTYTRRNLTSTDTVFALFEALNRNLDMTAVLPPIVCRYPFANDEIAAFCDDIEAELAAKARELEAAAARPLDLSLGPVRVMREFLRRRQMEESGVTGVSIWAESHAAIHTWDEDNYFAFDAFSCRDFRPKDALHLLLTQFDIEILNCVNLFRFQRSMPRVSNFQVNTNWEVIAGGKVVGELDSIDFGMICPGGPALEPGVAAEPGGEVPVAAGLSADGTDGRSGRAKTARAPRNRSRKPPAATRRRSTR